jgi:hypothetical protein
MAEPMTSDDAVELKSVMQQILAQMKDSAAGTTEYSRRTSELIAHEELGRQATAAATTATNNNTASMKSLASTMASVGQKLEKLGTSLNKTQNDFGISLASAAKLQVTAFTDTIKGFVNLFKSIDFSQLLSEAGEVGSEMANMVANVGKDFLSGKGISSAMAEGGKKIAEVLTKERSGQPILQVPLPKERMEATKKFQDEFGVINTQFGNEIATEAKNRGLSIDQLVQARRIFATTAMGDLNKVASIQTRFFDQFKSKGMTPKIALEAITKYAELIARNGNRFADSFARAAADAKKIGVDLSKVDQIGDSIIGDFEGFLEKSAELGAMGFNLDSNTLAQLAESGDTGALFNELRSQLAATGKDITKLRRSEQLALSGAFGISMADIQRLAGGTPDATSMEDYAEEGNSLLGKILALLLAAGPLASTFKTGFDAIKTPLGMLFDLAKNLGPFGWLALAIGGIALYLQSEKQTALRKAADTAFKENKIYEARNDLRLAGASTEEIEARTQEFLNKPGIQDQIKSGKMPGMSYSPETNQFIFAKTQAVKDAEKKTKALETGNSFLGKAAGGLVTGPGTGKSDSIPTRLSNGEFVINADMVKKLGLPFLNKLNTKAPMLSTGISKAQELSAGGAGGLLSMVQNRLGGKAGGMMSSISNLFTGGGSTTSNLMGMASKIPGIGGLLGKATGLLSGGGGLGGMASKIPGIGGLLGKATGLLSGGGGLGGIASGLLGKIGMGGLSSSLLGGLAGGPVSMLGSLAAPLLKKIPFVGGALSSIAGGPGKLLGKLGGSALGKIGGLFGKKKGGMDLSSMLPPNMMQTLSGMGPMAEGVNFPAMLAQMMGSQQSSQSPAASAKVDTSGIEQKLDQKLSNFITALSNIQVNMDGTKVGKLLVNVNDVAMTVGVYGTQAR